MPTLAPRPLGLYPVTRPDCYAPRAAAFKASLVAFTEKPPPAPLPGEAPALLFVDPAPARGDAYPGTIGPAPLGEPYRGNYPARGLALFSAFC